MEYTQSVQQVFELNNSYYLVEIWPNGKVTLKIKENGWSDTWSLPLEESFFGGRSSAN